MIPGTSSQAFRHVLIHFAKNISRAKSTFHKRFSGGSSDYFERPVDGFMKLAVVMDGTSVTIQQLNDSYEFSHVIGADQMARVHDDPVAGPKMASSVFKLTSS